VLQYRDGSEGDERQADPGEGNVLCFEERRKMLHGKRTVLERLRPRVDSVSKNVYQGNPGGKGGR
jgi:hypothetical protein